MAAAQQTYPGSELDALFPSPSSPPNVLSPPRYPGTSPEAVAALTYVLKDNHTKYHIFSNYQRFHNHITHRALALYATGASGSLIEQFYKQDSTNQRPAIEPPEAITEENFIEHLGDDNFYAAYRTFFSKVVKEKGLSTTLEEYIFSKKYNFIEGRDASTQPVMLARFLGALFHAFIHVGYGAEFGISGMVVEGLALASVHEHEFLPSYLSEASGTTAVERATTHLASLVLNTERSITPFQLERPQKNHAFSILAKIMQDSKFAPKEIKKHFKDFDGMMSEHGDTIWRYAEQWTIDPSQPGEIERKLEECIWTSTILYSIGGWSKDRGLTADFFFMHLVTSSLFLPSLLPYLPQDSQVLLLRGYFASTLGWWITRGFPRLDIQGCLSATSDLSSKIKVANPFLHIVQSAITHPDNHMLKIQRALAHFSSLYGARPKGSFGGTELEGAEALDGSLFIRSARLTEEYMSQGTRTWSQEGFPARA
ncbi:uncharacterized protein F5891DRAFT_1280784 [Suillus fuscotomentosus]|uniref:HypA-like protein n=1 Tax=Suillus fuscotomentosus TaxID=1912939 RepID=A0AAD4HH38_9AGAM|nr:uncharacterized protein F5891DRAFT_1166718 [Suillus fuscotomentosus]XP_041221838.1 uncharacterized protein F5891DRAFT_1280784 [Suillus fuscotomentosus]KAG1889810.1 hypothetical protein F5891DRAFT_1166718 [Suillus fuscotomentosus]KAG1896262.1 hypothetical protein F5891DRAFT_1280784 [Suillus fuscotomentosus]